MLLELHYVTGILLCYIILRESHYITKILLFYALTEKHIKIIKLH